MATRVQIPSHDYAATKEKAPGFLSWLLPGSEREAVEGAIPGVGPMTTAVKRTAPNLLKIIANLRKREPAKMMTQSPKAQEAYSKAVSKQAPFVKQEKLSMPKYKPADILRFPVSRGRVLGEYLPTEATIKISPKAVKEESMALGKGFKEAYKTTLSHEKMHHLESPTSLVAKILQLAGKKKQSRVPILLERAKEIWASDPGRFEALVSAAGQATPAKAKHAAKLGKMVASGMGSGYYPPNAEHVILEALNIYNQSGGAKRLEAVGLKQLVNAFDRTIGYAKGRFEVPNLAPESTAKGLTDILGSK